jgi:Domain of unknown function (DUF1918)
MNANVGDRIVVESEKVDVPERQGEILAIIEHAERLEFRVRWDDGHVSEIRPMPSAYRIMAAKETSPR